MMDNSTDFFSGHREWDVSKICHLVSSIVLTFVAPALLCAVVAYEVNDAAMQRRRRLLTNQLLSHTCIASIVRCCTVRIASVMMLHIGPFPEAVCDIIILSGRAFFLFVFVELTVWQLIKVIYQFWPKYLLTINDDFVACFLTLLNACFNMILTVFTYVHGYQHSEMEFHICTGNAAHPEVSHINNLGTGDHDERRMTHGSDFISAMYKILSSILIIMAALNWSKSLWDCLKNEPKSDYFTLDQFREAVFGAGWSLAVFIAMVLLLVPAFIARNYAPNNPDLINSGPGKVWTYVARITISINSFCMLPILTMVNSPNMRRMIKNKIISVF